MPFDDDAIFGREYNHPSWKEGKTAFDKGATLDENPHPYGTEDFDARNQGWHEAMTGQKLC